MRTEWIPQVGKGEDHHYDRKDMAKTAAEARKIAPWACKIVKRDGGWQAYESWPAPVETGRATKETVDDAIRQLIKAARRMQPLLEKIQKEETWVDTKQPK